MLACLLALACSHVDTLCPVQWQQLVRTHVAKNNRKRESCSSIYAGATHALLCRSARLCFSSSWLILTRRFFYPHHHHHLLFHSSIIENRGWAYVMSKGYGCCVLAALAAAHGSFCFRRCTTDHCNVFVVDFGVHSALGILRFL